MCQVENVQMFFGEGFLQTLQRKGIPKFVVDEIRVRRNIKRITVIDDVIQRDLLFWLDGKTTIILKRGQGDDSVLEWIACLDIGTLELTRTLYICCLYKEKIVLFSPFPAVEKALMTHIYKLETEYGGIRF